MNIGSIAILASIAAVPIASAADVIGTATSAEPVSVARIATLAPPERPQWQAYLERSQALMAADKAALTKEHSEGAEEDLPDRTHVAGNSMPLDRAEIWYGSEEARRVADNIVSFQTPAGGWGKNQNRAGPPRVRGERWAHVERLPAYAAGDIEAADSGWAYVGTIDNGATTTELRFLARVQARLPGARGKAYRASFLKGVRYLLMAQYPNGGWPQVYPLQGGYHDAVTYNDDAVVEVARLLAEVGARQEHYAFVPEALATDAREAAGKAIALLLASQVRVDGRRTIWAQQHDPFTLAPVGARAFEPAALATAESARILSFLMDQPDPSPAITAAVRDGVAWLEGHALRDLEWHKSEARLVTRRGAGPIWARFYDPRTFRPIFGDRDRTIRDDVNQVSIERRRGYSWFNTAPATVIEQFDRWRRLHEDVLEP